MFLARMISRAKWERKEWMSDGEISADAVTADLRTQNNNLSLWRCDSGANRDIDNVVLAIASGRDKVDKVEFVLIDDEDLKHDGHIIKDTNGRTPVQSLVKLHVDVMRLNYCRLGKVARRVASAVAANQCHRVSKKRVGKLLVGAVDRGEVKIEQLSDKLQLEVQELLS